MSGRTLKCRRQQPRSSQGKMKRLASVLGSASSHRKFSDGKQQGHVGAVAWRGSLQASGVASHILPGGLSGEHHVSTSGA